MRFSSAALPSRIERVTRLLRTRLPLTLGTYFAGLILSGCGGGSSADGESPDGSDGTGGMVTVSCLDGEYLNSTGDCTAWSECEPGQYVAIEGTSSSDRECASCANGTFSDAPNAASCEAWQTCAAGTFVSNSPSATQDRVCAICPDGTSTGGENETTCEDLVACAPGTEQTAPSDPPTCRTCVAGEHCPGGDDAATSCSGDEWDHDGDPATPCVTKTECAPGEQVASEGDATTDRTCAACATGTFSTGTNASSCDPWQTCSSGSYVTEGPTASADRACTACPAGTFSADDNAESCTEYTECAPGTSVATAPGPDTDRTCADCAPGTFSASANATACEAWADCTDGEYVSQAPSLTQDRVCEDCATGSFAMGTNSVTCNPHSSCQAGTRQTAAGTDFSDVECAVCAAGEYCAGGTDAAVACMSGTYDHDGDPATLCVEQTICDPGTFVVDVGDATTDQTCGACEDGFSTETNAEACTPFTECPNGTLTEGTPTSDVECVPPEVVELSGGRLHTCALMSDGTVECWGSNSEGSLGASTSGLYSTVPVRVSGLTGAVAISTGLYHSCAVLEDGTAQCWGGNGWGQLGDGTTGTNRPTPVPVSGLTGVVAISAGSLRTCAVLEDGSAHCWGTGYLGDGQPGHASSTPVSVLGVTDAIDVVTEGANHSCVLLEDRTVKCWGHNVGGQVGDGSTNERLAPVAVLGLTGVAALSSGYEHSCAVLNDGTARCWGSNSYGQVGNGGSGTSVTTGPVTVVGLGNAVDLDLGAFHSCALLSDGDLRCWGWNGYGYGQLGDGTTTQRPNHVAVNGLSGVVAFSAGNQHSCALVDDGSVKCWGDNDNGQLGDGPLGLNRFSPVSVGRLGSAASMDAGSDHTCAVLGDGSVQCWGFNAYGQLGVGTDENHLTPTSVIGLSGAVAITAGGSHSCASLQNGGVRCWGYNGSGQLGDGSNTDRLAPVTVPGVGNPEGISAGSKHTCALPGDGTVLCWGYNVYGALGDGSGVNSPDPVMVADIDTAVDLSAGDAHTCALLADGTAKCWGENTVGQLGDGISGFSLSPVTVSGLSSAVSLSAGKVHTCALLDDGTVKCWGTGASTATSVSGLSDAVALSTGDSHACAVIGDGTVKCWGQNTHGQLSGELAASPMAALTVVGVSDAAWVSGGGRHTCALLGDDSMACWGSNEYGQLGEEFLRTVLF